MVYLSKLARSHFVARPLRGDNLPLFRRQNLHIIIFARAGCGMRSELTMQHDRPIEVTGYGSSEAVEKIDKVYGGYDTEPINRITSRCSLDEYLRIAVTKASVSTSPELIVVMPHTLGNSDATADAVKRLITQHHMVVVIVDLLPKEDKDSLALLLMRVESNFVQGYLADAPSKWVEAWANYKGPLELLAAKP
jgi:hypothetical protein